MEENRQVFYVESVEGRKYKMVIRGNLDKLSVGKIRRYLHSYGVPDEQVLFASDGVTVLTDDMVGGDFGLHTNALLRLRAHPRRGGGGVTDNSHSHTHNSVSVSAGYATAVPRRAKGMITRDALLRALRGDGDDGGGGGSSSSNNSDRRAQQHKQRACDAVCALGVRLGVPLALDARSLTCSLATEGGVTVLLTYDVAATRLCLYTPLLTALPTDAAVRQKLYEVLLEGALLVRDVCGGGMAVSRSHNMAVLTASVDVLHCNDVAAALADAVCDFVVAAQRWRDLVAELVV